MAVVPGRDDKTDPRFYVGVPKFDDEPTDGGPRAPAKPAAIVASPPRQRTQPRAVVPPRFFPAPPRTLDEAGMTPSALEAAVLKAIFFAGELRGIDVASRLCLPPQLVEPALEQLRRQKLIDIRGGSGQGFGLSTMIYVTTALSREPLGQLLDRNRYNGPAPVPYGDWVRAVRAQSIRGVRVTRQMLTRRLDGLVVRDAIFDGLGPAMNSGRAIFFHGPPGNGKTAICQRMASCYSWDVFIPYAVEVDGFVVKVFDEVIHHPVAARDGDPPRSPTASTAGGAQVQAGAVPIDERWVRCQRPLVVVGGELTLDMLDMSYSPEVKFYEAPLQMKAANGVLLIDDFGRQRVSPRELLNRWIVPLENDVDYLQLATGKKFSIPFDAFLVFSTNLNPADLVDDAFLRRVRYKLKVEAPDEAMYKAIFRAQCAAKGLAYSEAAVDSLLRVQLLGAGRPLAACQPRDLVEQVMDHAIYQGETPALTAEALARAAGTYFAQFG